MTLHLYLKIFISVSTSRYGKCYLALMTGFYTVLPVLRNAVRAL